MKRIVLLITGALAIANIAGIMPFYSLGLLEVKREMQKELGKEWALDKLVIADQELNNRSVFHWVEADEINYRGSMYDIARSEKEEGYTVFYVIKDEKENNLLNLLRGFYRDHHQNGESESPLSLLLEHITKDFVPCLETVKVEPLLLTHIRISVKVIGSPSDGFCTQPLIPPGA